MVQSWNKFCFTGGVLEMSIKLPGHATSGGLWPAGWLMGNLARASFPKSTIRVWPWSYDKCGEYPDLEEKQEINACDPNPGYGMNPLQGRGAPEIDFFEVMPGHETPITKEPIRPFVSTSLQVSPGIPKTMKRPKNGEKLDGSEVWYKDIEFGPNGDYNYGFWGQDAFPHYQEDSLSVNTCECDGRDLPIVDIHALHLI
jgi:beta-glucan synthesis-associated protein KRE6